MTSRLMVLLAALLGLGGCIPMPYRFTLRPEVSGVILEVLAGCKEPCLGKQHDGFAAGGRLIQGYRFFHQQ